MTKQVTDLMPARPAKPAVAKTTMLRFKKKPDTIMAVQFTHAMAMGEQELPAGVDFRSRSVNGDGELFGHKHIVACRDCEKRVEIGDWIVVGESGYEVKSAEEFSRMYELA